MLETLHRTINGRSYEFVPLAAGNGGLATYRTIMGYLLPAVGGGIEAALKPLVASGALREGQDFDLATLKKHAPAILEAAAETGAIGSLGGAIGGLLHETKFVAAVHHLFAAGMSVDVGDKRGMHQPQADAHFGSYLGDYLPAVVAVLEANYKGAFFDALGARLTSLGAAAGQTKG